MSVRLNISAKISGSYNLKVPSKNVPSTFNLQGGEILHAEGGSCYPIPHSLSIYTLYISQISKKADTWNLTQTLEGRLQGLLSSHD